jgi:hypothetical protein
MCCIHLHEDTLSKKSAVGSDIETVVGIIIAVFNNNIGAAVEVTPACSEGEDCSLIVRGAGLDDCGLCRFKYYIGTIPPGQIGVDVGRGGDAVFLDTREYNDIARAPRYSPLT